MNINVKLVHTYNILILIGRIFNSNEAALARVSGVPKPLLLWA